MKSNYITIDILDSDLKYIKNLKKSLYKISNDPSFNIFPCLTIIGKTRLNSFKNTNINIIKPYIEFEKQISNNNNCTFINSINNEFINELITSLKLERIENHKSKYFSLSSEKMHFPIILLGNNTNFNKDIKKIVIKDIRLNIIEIEENNNFISYKNLSSIHLSMDKYSSKNIAHN